MDCKCGVMTNTNPKCPIHGAFRVPRILDDDEIERLTSGAASVNEIRRKRGAADPLMGYASTWLFGFITGAAFIGALIWFAWKG